MPSSVPGDRAVRRALAAALRRERAVAWADLKLDGEPVYGHRRHIGSADIPGHRSRAWIPFRGSVNGNYLAMFNAVARLRPGGTTAQAASEGTARGRGVADTGMTTMAIFGSNGPVRNSATSLKDALTADIRQPLVVLLAAVVLLLPHGNGERRRPAPGPRRNAQAGDGDSGRPWERAAGRASSVNCSPKAFF